MSDLLVSMGRKQHVLQPTHELGHTLDLMIARISDDIIAGHPYTGELFSDHFPVFCQLKPERPLVAVKHLQFRKIKSIDRDQFSEAICSSQLCLEPPDDLDTLVNCYNETLRSVLDIYAPVLTRDNRAVYTRENKPRLTLAAAYVSRERIYLYEYKLPGQDKLRLAEAVNVDFVPFIRGVRGLRKPRPELAAAYFLSYKRPYCCSASSTLV